jgi:inhibitor of KinA sporulation pathway (predicted exonuclease)
MPKKILCVDFEMLCHEKGMLNKSGIIVEVGACIVGADGIEDEFSSYIKPIYNKPVNRFTLEFIGADQTDFDNAPSFLETMKLMDKWCKPYMPKLSYWAAWGDKDYSKLLDSYRISRAKKNECFSLPFYDAQVAFQRKNYIFNRVGLNSAIDLAGIEHSLKSHKAIDDAKKMALLLYKSEYQK